ncbi:MAG: STAS domain-containing protein [Bacteroidota bacterium]
MEVQREQLDSGTILRVSGELDFSNVHDLQEQIETQLTGTVEVDLSGLAFMDSSGMGMLLNVARKLASRGQVLSVTNIPVEIRESMALVGFFHIMGHLFPESRAE